MEDGENHNPMVVQELRWFVYFLFISKPRNDKISIQKGRGEIVKKAKVIYNYTDIYHNDAKWQNSAATPTRTNQPID